MIAEKLQIADFPVSMMLIERITTFLEEKSLQLQIFNCFI